MGLGTCGKNVFPEPPRRVEQVKLGKDRGRYAVHEAAYREYLGIKGLAVIGGKDTGRKLSKDRVKKIRFARIVKQEKLGDFQFRKLPGAG
jgi:hypothetical protein